MTFKLPALSRKSAELPVSDDKEKLLTVYNALLLVSWITCLLVGKFSQYTMILSGVMLVCILLCFFDDNFYLYAALFMFFRYKMLLGDTPVFRIYTYLIVIKFLIDLPKYKVRIAYFPAILVFLMHCVFAGTKINARLSLNILVDIFIIYIILMKVLGNDRLMRKFIFVFLLGGIGSGVYGMTAPLKEVSSSISIRGAGGTLVDRNKGSLGDANYAGMFYDMCILAVILIKGIPLWIKIIFVALFFIFLLQTASLSALLTLSILLILAVILKYRAKSIIILSGILIIGLIGLAVILSVPQIREIPAINGIIIRVTEKLRYLVIGRWDLLTTDRYAIWTQALNYFSQKGLGGQLLGGSVITVAILDTTFFAYAWACHNSYVQSLLNFGILGAIVVYSVIFAVLGYRLLNHFKKPKVYENEDIKIIQIIFMLGFLIFGFTVDFFLDWTYLFYYLI